MVSTSRLTAQGSSCALRAILAVVAAVLVSSCTADEVPGGLGEAPMCTLPEKVYDVSVSLTLDGVVRDLVGECRSIGRLITFTSRDEIGSLRLSLEIPGTLQHGPPTKIGLLELGLPEGTYFMEDVTVFGIDELGRVGEISADRLLSADDERTNRDIRIQWRCT